MDKEKETEKTERISDRDAMRAKIFHGEKSRFKSTIISFRGVELEIRQPTLGDVLRDSENVDNKDLETRTADLLIKYCHVPGTMEKVFETADKTQLMVMSFDDEVRALQKAIGGMLGVDTKEEEKNSESTQQGLTLTS